MKPEVAGQKFDEGKLRFDLLLPQFEEAVVEVLTKGVEKYGANNWQAVEDGEHRYYAALRRHINAYYKGVDNDPEDGLSHLAHAACNIMFLMFLEERNNAFLHLEECHSA